ncbi:M24 family metallopeptidase [Nesterenkonia muleiensis]|uniref:M24 family metallopeptidase n=1 Tax=Nesterenkonia muleiensis TaxID=2282648 RepID=UPI000E7676D2|nr:M24 family metallopeptidase [Nesterenkonia muleiensis]
MSSTQATHSGLAVTEEFAQKHQRLIRVLDQTGADGVVLSSAGALSWLLGGARVHVSLTGPPVVRAVAHRDGVELAVFSNESERLQTEEVSALLEASRLRIRQLAWHQNIDDTGSWLAAPPTQLVDESTAALPLRAARAPLLGPELSRYRSLCRDAAAALTAVWGSVTPQTTEREACSALGRELISAGADPLVVLAAGDSRARHRHPLPTNAPLGRRAMAVVCARRDGLIANVTRWVCFSDPAPGELELDRAILEVEADIFDALIPGTELASVLEVVKGAYPRHGFDVHEWTRHHQGGAAGYQGRDPRAAPGVPDLIHPQQAFAWNPSAFSEQLATGAKAEDTVVLSAEAHGGEEFIEILSADPSWPSASVRGRQRPLPLYR